MSYMRFNARLDTSRHGPLHPFTDAGLAADSLTGIHNTMVSAYLLSTGAAHTRGCRCLKGKKPEDSNLASLEAMQFFSYVYPSVTKGVTENVSHSTVTMCRCTIKHSFSCNSQIKCFRTRVDTDIFSCFGMWNHVPKFFRTLQFQSVKGIVKL
jgi:hypothetical protein